MERFACLNSGRRTSDCEVRPSKSFPAETLMRAHELSVRSFRGELTLLATWSFDGPLVAVFEVNADGMIYAWREYLDGASVARQMGMSLADIEASLQPQ